jgi:hypothetical protein
MRFRFCALGLIASLLLSCGEGLASDRQESKSRTPEQALLDLVQSQQQRHVRKSVGVLAHECFTDRDLASFRAAGTPAKIVERLKQTPEFANVARTLEALPAEQRAATMRKARETARPTWSQMGFIDRQGRGQTEAGREAELMIARAIVDALTTDLGIR